MKFATNRYAVTINTPNRPALFRDLRDRLNHGAGFALATLNLDHLSKLPVDARFAAAYGMHEIIVADGRPVVWLSRIARQRVDLMTGADLIVPLCGLAAELQAPIALLGSNPAALAKAAAALRDQVPGLQIAITYAPPFGFVPDGGDADYALSLIVSSGARLCFVALGAPKQEIFAARGRTQTPDMGFVSIGAGLDFLAGHQLRAPRLMRRLALEWLWRAVQSPRRMVPRYARCFAILPGLTRQALRQRGSVSRKA